AARELEAVGCAFEVVDAVGLYPFRATTQVFTTAHSFRRHLQRELPRLLAERPVARPLARYDRGAARLRRAVAARWPAADAELLSGAWLSDAPFAKPVGTVATMGGSAAGRAACRRFVAQRLTGYVEQRNHPDDEATSGLSPYLHFGHVGTAEVFSEVCANEGWDPSRLGTIRNGGREGFWGMSAAAEAFLDQLVTWRELGFNACAHQR